MKYNTINNKNSKREGLIVFLLSIFCCLFLCSCQPSTKVAIKVDLTADAYSTGELSVQNGDYQDALNRCQQRLDSVPKDSLAAADAYKIMGGIYASYLKDKDTAVSYINKAIEIDEREKNEIGLARDYNQMSKIYISIGGDIKEGLQYIDKAEKIYEKIGMSDTSENAGTLVNKGRLYNIEGEHKKALDYMMKAQEIYIKDPVGEDAQLCIEIGQIYLKMKEYEKAKEVNLRAQEICIVKGDEYYLAEAKYQTAWIYDEQGDYETAIDCYKEALEYYNSNNNYAAGARVYNNMAYAANKLGWGADMVIPISIDANRTIEKVNPETISSRRSKDTYKGNLKSYYQQWSNDKTEEGFENWYQQVVLNGKDWKEVNVEAETKAN